MGAPSPLGAGDGGRRPALAPKEATGRQQQQQQQRALRKRRGIVLAAAVKRSGQTRDGGGAAAVEGQPQTSGQTVVKNAAMGWLRWLRWAGH